MIENLLEGHLFRENSTEVNENYFQANEVSNPISITDYVTICYILDIF